MVITPLQGFGKLSKIMVAEFLLLCEPTSIQIIPVSMSEIVFGSRIIGVSPYSPGMYSKSFHRLY